LVGCNHALEVGHFVLFEGDRGTEIGQVISMDPAPDAAIDAAGHKGLPLALRPAFQYEVDDLNALRDEALQTIPVCQEAVAKLGLPMTIVDAVYQFDREKLTFFYEASDRVDFRQLLREMYCEFRCRIWMDPVSPMASP